MAMTEKEVMLYIRDLEGKGSSYGLCSIRELLRRLQDPQNDLRFIHIAGTNGKGSVLAYVSTILSTAGYRVGRYISPAVFDYRERMQVNARPIPVQALCRHMERVKQEAQAMIAQGMPCPTAFEQETAAAFLWFAEKKCDVVVLETGLGGALDATNVIEHTVAAVLTSISMDHMALLGSTLEQIAKQKAGIIKNGCEVISAKQRPEAEAVLASVCSERSCRIRIADAAAAKEIRYGIEKQSFTYGPYRRLCITMAGLCQIENAVLAVEVISSLSEQGFVVTEAQLRQGLLEAQWPGRLSVVDKKPLFLIDGAHNVDAAEKLADSLQFYFTNRRIVYIMGILRDKEAEKIIQKTASLAAHIITVTPPHNERGMQAYELAQLAASYHQSVTAVDSLEEAVEMGRLLAGREGIVVAFGSLSYLGALTKLLNRKKDQRKQNVSKTPQRK